MDFNESDINTNPLPTKIDSDEEGVIPLNVNIT